MKKWCVILNPASKGGRSLKIWSEKIVPLLEQAAIDVELKTTNAPNHAIELTKSAIAEGYRHIVAAGGDGTIHEVANGILQQKIVDSRAICLAILPIGTGNDLIKSIGISHKVEDFVQLLKTGNATLQDVGITVYKGASGKEEKRYFINAAGTGFDAYVGNALAKQPKTGVWRYFVELLKGLFVYEDIPLTISSKEFSQTTPQATLTAVVGIGQYMGGGMKICPNAVIDDGYFDITLLQNISRLYCVKLLPHLYSGRFIKDKKVRTFRTKKLELGLGQSEISKPYLQLDGEMIAGETPFKFSLLPKALNLLKP